MIALKCSLVMLMLLAFLVVNAAGTVFRPADQAELQTAVDLWCSNRASAMATYGFIGDWDTSLITDMTRLFFYKGDFNDDISAWITSSVTTMRQMFEGASSFNQPLQNWDVTSVTDMRWMFFYASSFNNPLQNWDVTSVTTMFAMFWGASSFNQPLQNWDVTSVTDMSWMFSGACSFHQDLSSWNRGEPFMPGEECDGVSAAPTLEPTNPMTQTPTDITTAELFCADIKDWRSKTYSANDLVKLGVRVYTANKQNRKMKPTKHTDMWNFVGTCVTYCEGISEWRLHKWYKKGDIITDKQKKHLYQALRKAKGKSKKPGKANDNGKVYWKQIGMC